MCYNNPEMPREAGAVNFLEMSDAVMRKKISILGAGNVGATIAYTLAVDGMASEIVIVDINKDKAKGEALDIHQGTPLCPPVDIHDGDIDAVADSNIVIVTVGAARKPGQSRIDLAQGNVNIIKSLMPQVVRIARRGLCGGEQSGRRADLCPHPVDGTAAVPGHGYGDHARFQPPAGEAG